MSRLNLNVSLGAVLSWHGSEGVFDLNCPWCRANTEPTLVSLNLYPDCICGHGLGHHTISHASKDSIGHPCALRSRTGEPRSDGHIPLYFCPCDHYTPHLDLIDISHDLDKILEATQ